MWDLSVVVIGELLVLSWELSYKSSSCCPDVDSLVEGFFGDHEEFLLKSKCHDCAVAFGSEFSDELFAASAQNSLTSSVESLVIQGLPMVRDEKGRDVQGLVSVSEQDVGFDIPDGVGSGVTGLSEAT